MSSKTTIEKIISDAKEQRLAVLLKNDDRRADKFSFQLGDLFLDFSKTHVSEDLIEHYSQLASEHEFDQKKIDLYSGKPINMTEGRSVLHTLLRNTQNGIADMCDEQNQILANDIQSKFLDHIDNIRAACSRRNVPIRNIIHIGIGGSSLGPQLLLEALSSANEAIKVHFVDNIDGHLITSVLQECEPESTLVFGVSKTFTTQETLANLKTILKWYEKHDIASAEEHIFAVTACPIEAKRFGIIASNVVEFPEWVGGRYSIWSAVSLSVALILGSRKFSEFLNGASVVDKHFLEAAPHESPSFIAAAMDHFYANYFDAGSRATFAYDSRLRSLVPYLQQLETESNGKDRDIKGAPVKGKTSAVVWGGVGTGMQHSTFQLLHQGTNFIPVEFILVKTPSHNLDQHHRTLLANGLAQSAALLVGRSYDKVARDPENSELSEQVKKSKVFSGNKPSTTIILDSLTPYSLGQLLSFWEHRTFCLGVLANVNSFDQMGVELGKDLATNIEPLVLKDDYMKSTEWDALDSSTRNLLSQINEAKGRRDVSAFDELKAGRS